MLELRDAHAKLRTSNEKMRREKERHEREREEMRDIIASKRRLEQNESRSVNVILQQVDDLMKLFPELGSKTEGKQGNTPDTYTPTPPRRLKVCIHISTAHATEVLPSIPSWWDYLDQ